MKRHHIVLVGPMGSGKSTVGRDLARHFGLPHRDTDSAVASKARCSVDEIFRRSGEADFRRREAEALLEILAGPRSVVSTGGGIVVSPANRLVLCGHDCLVVWLDADVDALVKRVHGGRGRPLLQGDVESNLATKVRERAAFYEEVSDMKIDTTGLARGATVEHLITMIEQDGAL